LVRALGADRADTKTKDSLLLKMNTNFRKNYFIA
jgi:hypothetical protein